MSKIKVGIIGVGGIAKLHVPGWHLSEHAELIACLLYTSDAADE